MQDAEYIALVRRLIKEPTTRRVSDADILREKGKAVLELGNLIKLDNPDAFCKREVLQSDTNVFPWPTACTSLLGVWDLEGTATAITNCADNGSGKLRVTSAAHGLADGAVVHLQGPFSLDCAITLVDVDTFDVLSTTYAAAMHTAGGLVWPVPDDLRSKKMTKIGANEAKGMDDRAYYYRGRNVIVDDVVFPNDIIIDYYYNPSTMEEIPEEYHDQALVSYAVIRLIQVPAQTDPNFTDLIETKRDRAKMWNGMPDMISGTLIPVQEAINVDDSVEDSDKYIW